MKSQHGNSRLMRKEPGFPEGDDPYRSDSKLPDPSRCPKCKATYLRGRWTWRSAPEDAAAHTCPACRRIADALPAGYVTLRGDFLPKHHDEVLSVVTARETHAKSEHPMQRIMAVEKTADGLVVTTTDIHLARGIAHALHQTFKGELALKYSKAENLLRATWTR